MFSHQSSSRIPKPSADGHEMSELLKELRDVKSQLNTATEEKQTAKEETNYFKKELSDRLKEVHEVQNFMQSLATVIHHVKNCISLKMCICPTQIPTS